MKITLRKALNLKNKLVGEISVLGNEITRHNQYDVGGVIQFPKRLM